MLPAYFLAISADMCADIQSRGHFLKKACHLNRYLRDILSFKKNIGGSLKSLYIKNGGRFSKWLLRDKNNFDF